MDRRDFFKSAASLAVAPTALLNSDKPSAKAPMSVSLPQIVRLLSSPDVESDLRLIRLQVDYKRLIELNGSGESIFWTSASKVLRTIL